MGNEQRAYEHYVTSCMAHKMKPLTFDDWKQLIEGEIPNVFKDK